MKKRAIILGAGATGLITAWKLLENGWDVNSVVFIPKIAPLPYTTQVGSG